MITEGFVICTDAASKNKVEYDLLKSVNDIVFKEMVDWTRNPTTLRAEISKFGVWYFKKAKSEKKRHSLKTIILNGAYREDEENILKRVNNLDFILTEYEKYNKDKYEVKCLKYGKEDYEAYCLAKRQEKIQKTKKDKSL